MARKQKVDPTELRKQVQAAYRNRRLSDDFAQTHHEARGEAWRAFVGEPGQRLRALLAAYKILVNPRFPPISSSSLPFVRDAMSQLELALPELDNLRLCEWLLKEDGGQPSGWRELTPGLAQTVANDGRGALVIGVSPEVEGLAAVVYPDAAASATNPTVIMVSDGFALDPGTVLQGFRGFPCRFFGIG